MEEALLQLGLQTLVALEEEASPPEAAYHEEHNFEISCQDSCKRLVYKNPSSNQRMVKQKQQQITTKRNKEKRTPPFNSKLITKNTPITYPIWYSQHKLPKCNGL